MRRADSEINQQDDRGNRDAVADDRERPGVAGVALEHQTATRAALGVLPSVREEGTDAAMRTPPRDAASKGGQNRRDLCSPSSGILSRLVQPGREYLQTMCCTIQLGLYLSDT